MLFLAHRGLWYGRDEQNTETAIARSLREGFGVETDLRDLAGRLVVSHDPPSGGELSVTALFDLHRRLGHELPLALNIKADGLQRHVAQALASHTASRYFVFDMSIPDTLHYAKAGMSFFTRQSEYEPEPTLYEHASGVWIDCFDRDWFDEATLTRHLRAGKQVAIVSPELHGRDPDAVWGRMRDWPVATRDQVMLCTDHPERARRFFDA